MGLVGKKAEKMSAVFDVCFGAFVAFLVAGVLNAQGYPDPPLWLSIPAGVVVGGFVATLFALANTNLGWRLLEGNEYVNRYAPD